MEKEAEDGVNKERERWNKGKERRKQKIGNDSSKFCNELTYRLKLSKEKYKVEIEAVEKEGGERRDNEHK